MECRYCSYQLAITWLRAWLMSLKSPIFAGVNGSANVTTGEITYIMSPVVMHTAHVLCSLSPILFSVFINGLLKEVEQAGLGVELSDGSTIGGMLFADDFVGVSNSEEELQRLINVAHAYCCKWRLKANVSKSAVVFFARELVEGSWN